LPGRAGVATTTGRSGRRPTGATKSSTEVRSWTGTIAIGPGAGHVVDGELAVP